MSKLSDRVHNAIFYFVLCLIVVALAAVAAGAAIWFGVAWGLIFAAALAALIYWLAMQLGEAGYYAIPAWFGVAVGLVIGAGVRIWPHLLSLFGS